MKLTTFHTLAVVWIGESESRWTEALVAAQGVSTLVTTQTLFTLVHVYTDSMTPALYTLAQFAM